jgi:hypothetical protein
VISLPSFENNYWMNVLDESYMHNTQVEISGNSLHNTQVKKCQYFQVPCKPHPKKKLVDFLTILEMGKPNINVRKYSDGNNEVSSFLTSF